MAVPLIPPGTTCAHTGCDRLAVKVLHLGAYDYAFLCRAHYDFLTAHGPQRPS